MKLAFCLFKYYPFGGLERSFLNIAKACLSRGHEVDVFTMKWQGEKTDRLQVHIVPLKGLTNYGRCAGYVERLPAYLSNAHYDLIVGFNKMPYLDLYYMADPCFLTKMQKTGKSWIHFSQRFRVYSRFERDVFGPQAKTNIMSIADQAKEEYKAAYHTPATRFYDLPAGIKKEPIKAALTEKNREQIRNELGLSFDHQVLLMVGSDFKRKGVCRSLYAFASLPQQLKSKTHLAVIGKGKNKSYERIARKLDIGDRIHFLGVRNDVPRFLAAADILLHPALVETAGNAIVEAIVAGLPVLVTYNCGFSSHVHKSQAGCVLTSEPFSQQEMNVCLVGMLTDIEKRKQWQANGLKYADEADLYSRPEAAADIIEKLIRLKAHAD